MGRTARAPLRLGATLTLPFLKPAGCGVSAPPLVTAGSFPRSCHWGTGWGLWLCCPKAPEAQRCGEAASELSRCQLLVPITVWEGKAGRASAAAEQEEEHDGKGKHLVLLQGKMFLGCIRSLALSLQVPPDILGSCRKGTATRGQNPPAGLQLPGMLGTSWSHRPSGDRDPCTAGPAGGRWVNPAAANPGYVLHAWKSLNLVICQSN